MSTYHLDNESTLSFIEAILQFNFAAFDRGVLVFEIMESTLENGQESLIESKKSKRQSQKGQDTFMYIMQENLSLSLDLALATSCLGTKEYSEKKIGASKVKEAYADLVEFNVVSRSWFFIVSFRSAVSYLFNDKDLPYRIQLQLKHSH